METTPTIQWFDVQAGFGGFPRGGRPDVTAEVLRGHLQRCGIGRALVRMVPETFETDIPLSNEKLYAGCGQVPAFVACPVVVPGGDGRIGTERQQVDGAVARGAGAVCLRPTIDHFLPIPAVCDVLFAELARRRVPVLLDERLTGQAMLAELAERYPQVPLLYVGASYREYRNVVGILQRYANVYLAVGHGFIVHRAIEDLAGRVGVGRLLFGSGLPSAEPSAAQCMVACAELPPAELQQIASGNLQRLIEGIER